MNNSLRAKLDVARPVAAVPEGKPATENSPENAPKWESPVSEGQERQRIIEVTFDPANARKWESSVQPPRRVPNAQRRTREFLTEAEVEKLMAAAEKQGRHGHRDASMILLGFRHGLRVSELASLRWDQVDLAQGLLHVRRLKNGNPSTHPLQGPTIRALRRLRREYPASPYVFTTERKGPVTNSTMRKMMARAGTAAGLGFPVHPHMLRHAAGYKLANDGRDTRAIQHYLGHRNIMHTVRYTELSPERFKDFWND
jgi:type 1 fimbriae regulatory protein FimB/type 1 fimbriae regulatory protein FimE